jgi:hypothetical protein
MATAPFERSTPARNASRSDAGVAVRSDIGSTSGPRAASRLHLIKEVVKLDKHGSYQLSGLFRASL